MDSDQQNGVRLEKLDGHWTVFVVEDGNTFQQTFENEEFARNYAAGQKMRIARQVSTPGPLPARGS